ncbi:hypothetical protein D3C80_963300 [compost metagenome]
MCPMTAFGRSLPVVTTACAGQVECKRLVKSNANGWSPAMQTGGQFDAITHPNAYPVFTVPRGYAHL